MTAAVSSVAYELYSQRGYLDFVWSVWKRFRIKMIFEVLAVLSLVVVTAITLYEYVPLLQWGWLNLFVKGGGNIIFAPVAEGSKSSNEFVRILPLFFFVALLVALPFFAYYEEKTSRRGYHE